MSQVENETDNTRVEVNDPVKVESPAVCQILKDQTGEANHKETTMEKENESSALTELQREIEKRTEERDEFRKKLSEAESKLKELQTSSESEINVSREIEELKAKLVKTKETLEERERRVANQESQILALCNQVSSLKEVVAITKDMLSIRNMEVKHLQEDVDKMESRIAAERDRHNSMINKMDAAVRLNADLKKEYQTQLRLFQDLRGKYEEKVTLLSEENKALETAVQAQPAQ